MIIGYQLVLTAVIAGNVQIIELAHYQQLTDCIAQAELLQVLTHNRQGWQASCRKVEIK